MSFDKDTRNALSKMVATCRRLLTEDVTDQLRGQFGMHPDGTILPIDRLDLAEDEKSAAEALRELLDHFTAGEVGRAEERRRRAYDRLVLEISFTALNRLAALRLCEERGLVVECVRKGTASDGFRLFERLSGGGLGTRYQAYRVFLYCLFDELALDLGVLFDRTTPQSAVFPSERCLDGVLTELNKVELAHLWAADETIGWIYQYFNPREERKAMRDASQAPRNSRELAVRNQFFTPRYVVEFLTDNTLGRIWYEMRRGDTALADECRYLVRRPNEVFLGPGKKVPPSDDAGDRSQEQMLKRPVHIEHRPKKDPRNLRVLDPACGSGHFLLYAFDLLERIYEEAWSDPEVPAAHDLSGPDGKSPAKRLAEDYETLEELRRFIPRLVIEHNLNGIDIDPRAVQIAALALWLRAQKAWKALGLKATERPCVERSNIVTAEPMPGEEDIRREFTASLTPRVLGQLVEAVFEKMKLAGEAGSLLKIEDEIKDAIAAAKAEYAAEQRQRRKDAGYLPGMAAQREPTLFDFTDLSEAEFWEKAEDLVLAALKDYAEKADNGRAVRRYLFAEDAARGFAFIDLCRRRYDVVLMNPPFGAASSNSKAYLERSYPRSSGDVLANFVEHALILTASQGLVGAITNRSPFFLGTFENYRTEILGKIGRVQLLGDLGDGVLEATVETAAYVVSRLRQGDTKSVFFRLLIDREKGSVLQELASDCVTGQLNDRTFVVDPSEFERLRGAPYTYWVSRSTIEQLARHPRIEGNTAYIRVGMQTGDDFRFLRCQWEVSPGLVSPSPRPEDAPDLALRARCLDELSSGRMWCPYSKTETASPWFSPITLVVKWARNGAELRHFTNKAGKLRSALRSEQEYFKPGFSYMGRSTRLVPYLVPAGLIPTARRAQVFPEQHQEYSVLGVCASNIGTAVARFRGEKFGWPNFQAGMVQELPACAFPQGTLLSIRKYVEAEVDKRRMVVQGYEPFQEFTRPAWMRPAEGGGTIWDLCSLFGRDLEVRIADAFGLSAEQLAELERDIREAVSVRGTLEDTVSSDDPDDGEDQNDDEDEVNVELISELPEEKAIGLFMYAVGVAFGRWDIRIALDPSLAPKLSGPLDPLPVCPPGMLVGPDGLPGGPTHIASEEWLRARSDAITLPALDAVRSSTVTVESYPFRVSWDGILVDDPGFNGGQAHRDDIVRRVREVLDDLWRHKAHEIEQEVCAILGLSDLRGYFRRPAGFFQEHLKRYSKNRRKAPIYWPLSTASGSYTIWIYYQRLTDQTLYAVVNKYLAPKITEIEHTAAHIEKELEAALGRKATQLRDHLNDARSFVSELRDLREELLRIAALPYDPNLNDGVIINAAPFHKLFRLRSWAKDTEEVWKKLEKGDYDWAHLAYTVWPDHVKETCRKDRSIAIAHGFEELCEAEPPVAKGRGQGKGRKKEVGR